MGENGKNKDGGVQVEAAEALGAGSRVGRSTGCSDAGGEGLRRRLLCREAAGAHISQDGCVWNPQRRSGEGCGEKLMEGKAKSGD